ncbi:MAG TPA: hypothetical protein PK078_14305 [Anaerolineales bacterium]|nr:hypothetical protein [Anaerolineales bacterium]
MNRSLIATLTGWGVLILASWNALQAWTSLAWSKVLMEYSVRLSPMISATSALVFAIAGLVLTFGIWQNKAWSVKLLPIFAGGYTIWYWVKRLIWQTPHSNTTFAVIISLAWLTVIFFITKSLSREAYERNIENQTTE